MFGWGKKEKNEPAVAPLERDDLGLQVKVMDRGPCAVTLFVQVPADQVRQATENALKDIQARAKLPGFRHGKVPMDLVQKYYGDDALGKAIDGLIRKTVPQALQQEGVETVVIPSVDKVDYNDNKPLKFELKAECSPTFSLKGHKGLPLTKKTATVTDQDVEKNLEAIRESHATLLEVPDVAADGSHFVVVDTVGFLDGKPMVEGEVKEQLIEMSAPQSLAGFTDGLKGAKAGDVREIPVPFPEDHPDKRLAGREVVFKTKVTAIKEKRLPALDDEFAKDLGLQNMGNLRDVLRRKMESDLARNTRQDLEQQILEGLLERNSFEVPVSLVTSSAEQLTQNLKRELSRRGGGR